MTYIDAAIAVLGEASNPLATAEMTHVAVQRGYLVPAGRTPEASMSAALYREIAAANPRIRKIAGPGLQRAVRGSVRWALIETAIR